MRSANSQASSIWCRMHSTVVPRSRACRRSSDSTSWLVCGSRLATGSSASTSGGSSMKARAMPTRCCWPPESSLTRRSRCSSPRPTDSTSSQALRRCASVNRPSSARQVPRAGKAPASTFSATLERSTRLNCWWIMPMRGRTRASEPGAMRTPSTRTVPCVGTTRPLAVRSRVDLPAPEAPSTTQNWPAGTSSETPPSARVPSGWRMATDSNCSMGVLPAAGSGACVRSPAINARPPWRGCGP